MDHRRQRQENAVSEAFAVKFAGLTTLWAILYTIAGRIGPQIPQEAGGLAFLLQAVVTLPVMAALRMTYKKAGLDGTVRFFCRMMYLVMVAALILMLAAAIWG